MALQLSPYKQVLGSMDAQGVYLQQRSDGELPQGLCCEGRDMQIAPVRCMALYGGANWTVSEGGAPFRTIAFSHYRFFALSLFRTIAFSHFRSVLMVHP